MNTDEDEQISKLKEIDDMIANKNTELDRADDELTALENQLEIKNQQLSTLSEILDNAEEKYQLFDELISKYEEEARFVEGPQQSKAELLEEVKSFYREFDEHESKIQNLISDPQDLKDLIIIASDVSAKYQVLEQKARSMGINVEGIHEEVMYEEEEDMLNA